MEEENEPPLSGGGGAGGNARRERRANRQAAHLGSGVREREITGYNIFKIFFLFWCFSGFRIYGLMSGRISDMALRYPVNRILNLISGYPVHP